MVFLDSQKITLPNIRFADREKAYDTEFSRIFSVPILFPYRRLKKTLIGSRYSCVIKTSNLSTLRDYRYNRLHFTGTFEVYVKVALINLIFIATSELSLN